MSRALCDASTQTDSDGVQREIEALEIELGADIISQEYHDKMVLAMQAEANIVETSCSDKLTIPSDTARRAREKRNSLVTQAQNKRIDAMEKQIQELSAKLQTFEGFESALFPDVEKMRNEMYWLHRIDGPVSGLYVKHRYDGDFIPCIYKGVKYWQSTCWDQTGRSGQEVGQTRLFDFTTYEYVGALRHRDPGCEVLLINPVYAVKYKDKYPELFKTCIDQKRKLVSTNESPWELIHHQSPIVKCPYTSPAAIQVQLDEDEDLHIKTGVYSFKYEDAGRTA